MAAKKKATKKATKKSTKKTSTMSEQEQIGYHKGALSTLAKERQELVRILNIVEQLMQFHMGALQELGIDLAKEMGTAQKTAKKGKKPIDEII